MKREAFVEVDPWRTLHTESFMVIPRACVAKETAGCPQLLAATNMDPDHMGEWVGEIVVLLQRFTQLESGHEEPSPRHLANQVV